MDERKEILEENYQEYFELAKDAFEKKKFNAAVTLFFKAIVAGADLLLLEKEGQIPSSNTSRFRITQNSYPEIYNILDKDFPFYQDSYTKKMDDETAEVLFDDAKRIKQINQLSEKR
jgi:hypothetical protein